MFHRPSDIVVRGVKSIQALYTLTNRVPNLVQQSHLDPRDGPYVSILQSNEC